MAGLKGISSSLRNTLSISSASYRNTMSGLPKSPEIFTIGPYSLYSRRVNLSISCILKSPEMTRHFRISIPGNLGNKCHIVTYRCMGWISTYSRRTVLAWVLVFPNTVWLPFSHYFAEWQPLPSPEPRSKISQSFSYQSTCNYNTPIKIKNNSTMTDHELVQLLLTMTLIPIEIHRTALGNALFPSSRNTDFTELRYGESTGEELRWRSTSSYCRLRQSKRCSVCIHDLHTCLLDGSVNCEFYMIVKILHF